MTAAPALHLLNQKLPLGDGSDAIAGFLKVSEQYVALRIRFADEGSMRRYSSGAGLEGQGRSLPWQTSTGGSGALASVLDMVFEGSLAANAEEVTLRLAPQGKPAETFLLRLWASPN